MITYFTGSPGASRTAMTVMQWIGRLLRLDEALLHRADILLQERQAEYALGFLAWFLLFKLRLPLPDYNIYHLVTEGDTERVKEMLAPRQEEFRVARQYYCLDPNAEIDDKFRQQIVTLLTTKMRKPKRNTAYKIREFDTDDAFTALTAIDNILRGERLNPFLISGTLLGFVRDNRLVEGDNDLDIGIMSEEASAEDVFTRLRDHAAFRTVYNLGHLVQATHHNGTVIDIFIHYREGHEVWHGTDIHQWVNTPFDLVEREFCGHRFLVPEDSALYLDENYGNWRSPVLFWDYSFDTPNRRFFRSRKTAFYLADRIVNELGKKHPGRHAVQSAIDALYSEFSIDLRHHLGTPPTSRHPEKVVITFGTFDLFHIGHLNILQRAAELGNKLVVGVSSDALNYSKKNTYPVYCETDRMEIVKSIACVDDVFLEESLDLKRDYVKQHNADVLVMGEDWKGKFDHLADSCKVIYLARTENISTSETKDAIKNNL